MRTLYVDCFSGLAGDMMLGGLLDLAERLGIGDQVNHKSLSEALSALSLPPWQIDIEPRHKQGIRGLGVKIMTPWGEERVEDVTPDHHHADHHHAEHDHAEHHKHGLSLAQILDMIKSSDLNSRVKRRSREVFEVLGEAEGAAHGVDPLDVHFHEVGMVDSLVDIIGSAWCLDALDITRVISAPPPLNRGWVRCAHGLMPLPAPATAFILTGVETAQSPHQVELVTPTGAAMIRAWSHQVTSSWPADPALAIGWGAGKRDLSDRPNLLRLVISESALSSPPPTPDLPPAECWLIEANIDDQSPEALATARDLILSSGALDVWLTPIVMKEGRSAVKLSVLCVSGRVDHLERLLLTHSAAIGCRRSRWTRTVLPRRLFQVATSLGSCQVKVTRLPDVTNDERWRLKVEHRDARKIASVHELSLAEVEREVLDKAHALLRSGQVTWDHLDHETPVHLTQTKDDDQ